MAHILVVDDSKSMREAISRILMNADHEVATASDGDQALDMAKQTVYDMVLSDIYMPGKTGIALVALLRRLDGYRNIPILLITTENSKHMKEKSRNLGANGWLTKPIDSTRLLTAVNKTFQKFQ